MNSDKDNSSGGPRLAPRPVSRPPVGPESTRVCGRPRGVDGSFHADQQAAKYRQSAEYTPAPATQDPVLQEQHPVRQVVRPVLHL